MVKEFLSQNGIKYEERDVALNSSYAQELMRDTGQMGVPVTVIDGQVVVGFDRVRLQQLINKIQQRRHPAFGASIADANKITAKQGPGITLGAYVGRVRPGSIAERIGLAPGDIITELNMKSIANAKDLEDAIAALDSGSRFPLSFIRDDRTISTEGILDR